MTIDNLNPYWVTGFVDKGGCFSISFSKRKRCKFGIEIRPSFSISHHYSNLVVLNKLHDFFGCGGIRYSKKDRTYKYEVRNLDSLVTKIIPRFQLYSLQTSKQEDFNAFVFICLKLKQNLHKQQSQCVEIIEIAYSMNLSGVRKYRKEDLLKLIIS